MYSTGANKSKYDIRTFSYIPTKANIKGGSRYELGDIEDQHNVGICTAISMTMNARKVLGRDFSDDFQYLLQKKFIDGNWDEGSSAFSALKVGTDFGFLPQKHWTATTLNDRKLSYSKYIKKLQAVSDDEIQKLLEYSKEYKLSGYAKIPVDRDSLSNAIDESKAGIITRFNIDRSWWTSPIEPLTNPDWYSSVTGHLVTTSNYDGGSYRIANSWGQAWADGGTAYHLLNDYAPTEAWIPYYDELPEPINDQKEDRKKVIGQIKDLLQKVIDLLGLLV